MAFSYNPHSEESYSNQYYKNLQKENYVAQIIKGNRDSIELNAKLNAIQASQIRDTVQLLSERQREATLELSESICYVLENEFSVVNESLESINFEIRSLSRFVRSGLSLVIEQLKIANTLLGEIKTLLKIPDSQKQRVYHISEGLKFLYNAANESAESDFYSDALDEFKKSVAIESKDFFSLYRIGFILLKSKHYNPSEAEICFRNAARYYLAEAYYGGTDVSNSLLKQDKNYILEATEALLFAAEACYHQKKYNEATKLAQQAWETSPEVNMAGFYLAKYLAADYNVYDAANVLERAIKKDRQIYVSAYSDLDLLSKPEIVATLERICNDTYENANQLYNKCKNNLIAGSIASDELLNVEKLVLNKEYLTNRLALDLLTIEKDRMFSDISDDNGMSIYNPNLNFKEFKNVSTITHVVYGKIDWKRLNILPSWYESPKIFHLKIKESILDLNRIFNLLNENTPWILSSDHKNIPYKLWIDGEMNHFYKGIEDIKITPKSLRGNLLNFILTEQEYLTKLYRIKNEIQSNLTRFNHDFNEVFKKIDDDYQNLLEAKQKIKQKKFIGSLLYFCLGNLIGGYLLVSIKGWAILIAILSFIVSTFILEDDEASNANTKFGKLLIGIFIGIVVTWIFLVMQK